MFNINFALDWIQTADLWTLESEATTLPMSQNDCPIVNFFFHLKLEWGNFWKFRVFACGTLGRTLASGNLEAGESFLKNIWNFAAITWTLIVANVNLSGKNLKFPHNW